MVTNIHYVWPQEDSGMKSPFNSGDHLWTLQSIRLNRCKAAVDGFIVELLGIIYFGECK